MLRPKKSRSRREVAPEKLIGVVEWLIESLSGNGATHGAPDGAISTRQAQAQIRIASSAVLFELHAAVATKCGKARLTWREGEILACLVAHQSNKEIANRLGIETSTVKSHVHCLLGKVGVTSRRELAAELFATLIRKS